MFSSKTIRSLWGALGSFWGALFYNLVKKWTFQFRAFGSQVRSLPSKNDLPELIPGDPRGSANAHKVTFGPQLATRKSLGAIDYPAVAVNSGYTGVQNLSIVYTKVDFSVNSQKSSFCSWW